MADIRNGFLIVAGCFALCWWIWPYREYNQSLVCKETTVPQILAEHAKIDRVDGVYVLKDRHGKTMIYEKSAFAYCVVLADADVNTVTSQGAK